MREITLILRFIDQATKPIQQATKGIGGAVKGIKNRISDLAKHARWASVFIGAAFAKIAKDAISMAAEFEKFPVAAEFLLGSAEAANEFAKSVRNIATESIFGIDQVTELGKRLVGNTRDVQKSEAALKALIDAVAATGGGYSELESATRAWIQTNAKAKASSEELNRQFANANIPVLRVLAESIVKDVNHPLRKYIATAGGATGVNKKLTTSFQKASENLPIYEKQLKASELALKRVKDSGMHIVKLKPLLPRQPTKQLFQ